MFSFRDKYKKPQRFVHRKVHVMPIDEYSWWVYLNSERTNYRIDKQEDGYFTINYETDTQFDMFPLRFGFQVEALLWLDEHIFAKA